MQLDLLATFAECAALAARFEVSAITHMRAIGALKRLGSARVRLRVTLEAKVSQTCVVSLDPVVKRIKEKIDIQFEYQRTGAAALNIAFDPSSDCEPLVDDLFDVGEFLAEELALSLDPYPKKPGITPGIELDGFTIEAKELPGSGAFEALAVLKRKE